MIFQPEFIVLQCCGEEGNQGMRFSGMRFEAMIAERYNLHVENEMTLHLLPGGNMINHNFPDSKSKHITLQLIVGNSQRVGYLNHHHYKINLYNN